MYEAFVYKWTDHKYNRFYIGYHKGTFDDGYVCSSKTMLKEYVERPHDFTRDILMEGSVVKCRAFEISVLKEANAAGDPNYYNLNNGGYHIVFTDEVRNKMSAASKGKPKTTPQWLTGKKMPEAMKAKISASSKGKTKSEETRRRMSEAQLKIPRKGGFKQSDFQKSKASSNFSALAECPHCGKVDRKGAIARYHFDRCSSLH